MTNNFSKNGVKKLAKCFVERLRSNLNGNTVKVNRQRFVPFRIITICGTN